VLLVGGTAAALVVLIALAVGLPTGGGKVPDNGPRGSLAAAVTGPTDRLVGADTSGIPSLSPTPGRQEPSKQQWLELLPKLEGAVQQNPADVGARRKLALAYYNLGRFPEAQQIYGALLAAGEDAVLRDRLGNTLRDMGDPAGAEAAYHKAIADDPTLAPAYINLAELLWRRGSDDEALKVLDTGIAAVSEPSRANLEKARRLLAGETGEA
jgi:tetratricopeptide (TPR) repeat protein